jgi:proteasome lid subunit RPN8/RPN11
MTLNDAFEGRSLKTTHLIQRGSLLALAVTATLILTFGRHNGFMVGVVLALSTVVAPAVYVLGKRLMLKVRQRETEARLVMQTKDYLQNHESECVVRAVPAKGPEEESDIEILARVIDGRKLPTEDFRRCQVTASIPQEAQPVVFDALPRRYAVRSLYERRFADLAATLPKAVCMPLGEVRPAAATREFGYWVAGPRNLEIEYSSAAIDEIRMQAAEGYQRMRHGGVEVGGVLFGTHAGRTVRILAMRPIECGYSNGPRFILSELDETALANLLKNSAGDPELADMEPVGWYHSHTREEIYFSPADVRLFDRFFPQAWQVALVVRPANLTPTRAGFFFREPDGTLRTASSYCEFHLGLMASAAAA